MIAVWFGFYFTVRLVWFEPNVECGGVVGLGSRGLSIWFGFGTTSRLRRKGWTIDLFVGCLF
jgi:hypothetical protein